MIKLNTRRGIRWRRICHCRADRKALLNEAEGFQKKNKKKGGGLEARREFGRNVHGVRGKSVTVSSGKKKS